MKKYLYKIDRLFANIALFFIYLYQKLLSPDVGLPSVWLKGRICSHEPHCSKYGKECFERYGFFTGLHYTIERVTTCIPSEQKTYDPSVFSVVFFSSASIGNAFMTGLVNDKRFNVTGVVTMPDAARGRGMKIQENVVARTARQLGVHEECIKKPHSLKLRSKKRGDEAKVFHSWLDGKKPDFIVVVAYGKIIPQAILDMPKIGPINVHGSLLPKYRGASPLQSVFLHKEKETGMTIMRMHAELDAGDCIDKKVIPLSFRMHVKSLIDIFEKEGPDFLQETLRSYGKGRLIDLPQEHDKATFTTKIVKEDALIDIHSDTLEDIYAKYKAYVLRPKIYFLWNNKRVVIEEMHVDQGTYEDKKLEPLVSATGDTCILHASVELQVKPEGKKSMQRIEFKRGYMQ